MDYNYRITGQIIGRIRTQQWISQEVLSGLSGIARSHLAMIETGTKNATVDTLWRIAAAPDIRLSNLIKLIEEEHEQSFGKIAFKTLSAISKSSGGRKSGSSRNLGDRRAQGRKGKIANQGKEKGIVPIAVADAFGDFDSVVEALQLARADRENGMGNKTVQAWFL